MPPVIRVESLPKGCGDFVAVSDTELSRLIVTGILAASMVLPLRSFQWE